MVLTTELAFTDELVPALAAAHYPSYPQLPPICRPQRLPSVYKRPPVKLISKSRIVSPHPPIRLQYTFYFNFISTRDVRTGFVRVRTNTNRFLEKLFDPIRTIWKFSRTIRFEHTEVRIRSIKARTVFLVC